MPRCVLILIVLNLNLFTVYSKNFTYSDLNLSDNKYLVDKNDKQVIYVATEINKKFNLDHVSSKYIHLLRVDEAKIQVKSGLIWHVKALVSPTDCNVEKLDFNNKPLDELAIACDANSIKYEKYFCRFIAQTYPGELDLKLWHVQCAL